ncbi:MAG: AMP-binding protein, partial [Pseudomonadota bacterium]
MIDLFGPILRNAAFSPDTPAIRFERTTITYGRFAARVRAIGAELARDGVTRGDRVAVLAENHPDTLALLYALSRLGAMLVPLNWRLADEELTYALDHCAPAFLVHGPGYGARAMALAGQIPLRSMGRNGDLGSASDGDLPEHGALDDPCLLVFTSGTTGRPKGALLSQRALLGNAIQSHHMHQMTASDHILTVLPLFHVGGLNIQTTPALMMGATVT